MSETTAKKKLIAHCQLVNKMVQWDNVKPWRYACHSRYGARLEKERNKARGAVFAKYLARAIKAGKDSTLWVDAWCATGHMVTAFDKYYPGLNERLADITNKIDVHEWVSPKWDGFRGERHHFLHTSVDDPTKVAYYPDMRHLMAGREVRTTPGRYLTKFHGADLSESAIREMANRHIAMSSPQALNFVENTDPDGWEWVYEHGHGFTSCMVRDRSGRYLAGHLYGYDHPVRAYAYKGNGLRLAWLGRGYKQSDGEVYARAIVRNTKDGEPLGHIRVYGDDSRLSDALRAAGYGRVVDLDGVELALRRDDNDRVICPYIDGDTDGVEVLHDRLVVGESGGYNSSSDGLLETVNTWTCACCEEEINEDADGGNCVGYHEDSRVCDDCFREHYTEVRGRSGHRYYLHDVSVIWVGGCAYDEGYLSDNDIYECDGCGEFFHVDNMYSTSDGLACEDCAVALDIDDEEGNSFALEKDVATDPNRCTFHADEGCVDRHTDEVWHKSEMFSLASTAGVHRWFHKSTLTDNPELFRVVDGRVVYYSEPSEEGLPITEALHVMRTKGLYGLVTNEDVFIDALKSMHVEHVHTCTEDERVAA